MGGRRKGEEVGGERRCVEGGERGRGRRTKGVGRWKERREVGRSHPRAHRPAGSLKPPDTV